MKFLLKYFLITFFTIFGFFTSSLAIDGHMTVFNNDLKYGAEQALNHFEGLFPNPGPTRVQIRKMLEALVGLKRNGRAFNPSIVSHDDGYIFAIRVTFHNSDMLQKIIPGNRAESKFEKGKNFWWQDFNSEDFSEGTLYFHADKDFQKFSILAPGNYASFSEGTFTSDVRITKINDDIVAWNPKSHYVAYKILELQLIPKSFLGVVGFGKYLRNLVLGNNYGLINIDFNAPTYSYIDWFFPEGIRFARASDTIEYDYLKYLDTNYPILGTGSSVEDGNNAELNSGIMPLFSLGSTHIKLDEETYLGVGHTKIHVDEEQFTYKEESPIDQFRKSLTTELKSRFGDRYIRNDAFNSKIMKSRGYHYLMYFYTFKLNHDGKPIEMKISDSYLPINIKDANNAENYVFSLVFPMGVTNKVGDDQTIKISAGIGDYYSALMELPKQFVIEQCRHDATNLNMNHYNYKIMRFDGEGQFEVVNPADL